VYSSEERVGCPLPALSSFFMPIPKPPEIRCVIVSYASCVFVFYSPYISWKKPWIFLEIVLTYSDFGYSMIV
jgi:hypothetical protein